MKARSRPVAKSGQPRAKLKRGKAPKGSARSNSSPTNEETDGARLTRELGEALEQQSATSEVLQVISGSPGDLQPVFAAMLDNAVRICNATFGIIYRWDGEFLHAIASHKTPPAPASRARMGRENGQRAGIHYRGENPGPHKGCAGELDSDSRN
jgi:hypothetical protein